MQITNLRANFIEDPIGYDMTWQTLTWVYEGGSDDAGVLTARVRIAQDPAFEILAVDSGDSKQLAAWGHYELKEHLKPCTRYYWQVQAVCSDGGTVVSRTAFFETGKMDQPWRGQWLCIAKASGECAPMVRKSFRITRTVESARIYMTGLGLYECYLNNQLVNDGYLQPGFNNYNFWIQYQTYDITDCIHTGENVLGFLMGAGWYKGRFGVNGGFENNFGDNYQLLCEIQIVYADGSTEVIGSDESFEWADGPVIFSNIYDGETYDGRLEPDWMGTAGSNCKADDISQEIRPEPACTRDGFIWHPVKVQPPERMEKLSERLSVPVTAKTILPVKRRIVTPTGKTVLDFGQNLSGWLVIKGAIPAGWTVTFTFAEHMQKGEICRKNLLTAKQTFTYTGNGKEIRIRPHFTYFGFRYVQVEGIQVKDAPADISASAMEAASMEVTAEGVYALEISDFQAWNLYSDLPDTGSVDTGVPEANQFIQNALWSQRDNFTDHPTDCPQRAERLGWTGDAQMYCAAASNFMYTPAFYRKYMRDVNEEQKHKGGRVPFIVPKIAGRGMESKDVGDEVSAAWSDVAAIIPWTMYLYYGDKNLLAEEYEGMKAWVAYMRSKDEENGNHRLWQSGFHFGDWLALDNPKPGPFGKTDPYYIASAYYYYSTLLTAKAAKILEKDRDYTEYSRLAEEIRTSVQNTYFDADGMCMQGTQTGYAVAVFMELVDEAAAAKNAAALVQKIADNGGHLDTGFVGTPYLCRALSKAGYHKEACALFLQKDCPGWLYQVRQGATTVWESWDALDEKGELTGDASLNHYAFGSVVEWLFRDVCGINPMEEYPGGQRMLLEPRPSKLLGRATGQLTTGSGTYKVQWSVEENRVHYEIVVPYGGMALLRLPDHKKDRWLMPGKYAFDNELVDSF